MNISRLTATVLSTAFFSADALAQATPPLYVPHKTYSNLLDETALGVVDPLQNILWDNPMIPLDGFDYSTSGPPPVDPDQVDALANNRDHLFNAVATGSVPFVCSFSSVAGFAGDSLYDHDTSGGTALWARGPSDINRLSPPNELDGVELWGPNQGQRPLPGFLDDANHYSYIGDCILPGPPAPPGTPRISVFHYDPFSHTSSIYIRHAEIAMALQQAYFLDPSLPTLDPGLLIDVDALMVFDEQGNPFWEDFDTIIFSLRPTADTYQTCQPGGPVPAIGFDGGEIWVWRKGPANGPDGVPFTPDDNPAFLPRFLSHGGRVWDTPNPVASIFGVPSENIDAFEAVTAINTVKTCAGDGSYPSVHPLICPCGNTSTLGAGEGCLNSSFTVGGTLCAVQGSTTSFALDNFRLDATHPPGNSGLLLVDTSISPLGLTFFSGLNCVMGGPRVLPGGDNGMAQPFGDIDLTASDGVRNLGGTTPGSGLFGLINATFPGYITPGTTYHAQFWHRDVLCGPPPAVCITPCVAAPMIQANFTSALTFVVGP